MEPNPVVQSSTGVGGCAPALCLVANPVGIGWIGNVLWGAYLCVVHLWQQPEPLGTCYCTLAGLSGGEREVGTSCAIC